MLQSSVADVRWRLEKRVGNIGRDKYFQGRSFAYAQPNKYREKTKTGLITSTRRVATGRSRSSVTVPDNIIRILEWLSREKVMSPNSSLIITLFSHNKLPRLKLGNAYCVT
ncbi:hypothetical protein J6590_027181 [Homalodisca vitripennis]|nr:hypothetical protein J6590_027181 [Homalodisca vitripennis]